MTISSNEQKKAMTNVILKDFAETLATQPILQDIKKVTHKYF